MEQRGETHSLHSHGNHTPEQVTSGRRQAARYRKKIERERKRERKGDKERGRQGGRNWRRQRQSVGRVLDEGGRAAGRRLDLHGRDGARER
jgi:hypothetical protein